MKKIATILSILIIALSLQTQAQTRKTKAKPKKAVTTTTTKKTTAVKSAEAPKAETKTVAVSAPKRVIVQTNDDYYKTALGVKFLYGISLTAKHFINDKGALEAVIQYRHHSGIGSEFNFTGLYEYHGKIAGASGLRWYAGGGAYAGYFSFDDDGLGDLGDGSSNFTVGAAGVVGLEYKIKGAPLAVSADWQPIYIINGNGSGFASDNGGIGLKYTF